MLAKAVWDLYTARIFRSKFCRMSFVSILLKTVTTLLGTYATLIYAELGRSLSASLELWVGLVYHTAASIDKSTLKTVCTLGNTSEVTPWTLQNIGQIWNSAKFFRNSLIRIKLAVLWTLWPLKLSIGMNQCTFSRIAPVLDHLTLTTRVGVQQIPLTGCKVLILRKTGMICPQSGTF